jgi:hypothetical protein
VGASTSASARTTTVDRHEQARLAAARSGTPATAAGDVAGIASVPVASVRRDLSRRGAAEARARREQERKSALLEAAVMEEAHGEPIAEIVPVVVGGNCTVPPPDNVPRLVVVGRLVGSLVDIVGTNANDRGRACSRHYCCGEQVTERSMVAFWKKHVRLSFSVPLLISFLRENK